MATMSQRPQYDGYRISSDHNVMATAAAATVISIAAVLLGLAKLTH
jgi:hypothetical protein